MYNFSIKPTHHTRKAGFLLPGMGFAAATSPKCAFNGAICGTDSSFDLDPLGVAV